jgi:hypothetical protein
MANSIADFAICTMNMSAINPMRAQNINWLVFAFLIRNEM